MCRDKYESSEVHANRRIEYEMLRHEILLVDRSCIVIMGFLFAATAALWELSSGDHRDGWLFCLLSLVWLLGFGYITDKRLLIFRIAKYLRKEVEVGESGLNWETELHELRESKAAKKIFPFSAYPLEVLVCSVMLAGVPIAGVQQNFWSLGDPEFVMTLIVFCLFLMFVIFKWNQLFFMWKDEDSDEQGT